MIPDLEIPPENIKTYFGMTIWHWLILIGTAVGTVLEGLLPHSFGTFIANFRTASNKSTNFDQSDQTFIKSTQFQLNWLPALSSSMPCILLPLFSIAIKRINRFYQIISMSSFLLVALSCILSSLVIRWPLLFLTYSAIYSIGTSIFLAVVVAILADYFPLHHKRHVLATSLYQIGYPTAAIIGNPILASLIVAHGWRTSMKYIALIQVIFGVFIGFIMKPLGQTVFCAKSSTEVEELHTDSINSTEEPQSETNSMIEIIRTYQFWTWLIGKYVNYVCWYGLRTNIMTYLVASTTFGLERSSHLMSAYAGAEVVVALLASAFGDRLRGWLIHVHIVAATAMAVLTGIFSLILTSYLSAVLLMMCVGTAVQFSLSFGYPASVEVLDSKFDMKIGWIITNVVAGLGILTSPCLSGLLMDKFRLATLFYAQCIGWTFQLIFFVLTLVIIRVKKSKVEEGYYELQSDQ